MSCYCDYDDGMPDFYAETHPVARRQHVCYECCGTINKGEKYKRASGKWDGRMSAFKTCQRCLDFEANVRAHVPCFRVCAFGELYGNAIECLQEYQPEASTLLFGAYRGDIRRRRNATALRAERQQTA